MCQWVAGQELLQAARTIRVHRGAVVDIVALAVPHADEYKNCDRQAVAGRRRISSPFEFTSATFDDLFSHTLLLWDLEHRHVFLRSIAFGPKAVGVLHDDGTLSFTKFVIW